MPKTFPLILISLLLILGIIFFWWPKYQEFGDLKIKLKERKTELENKDKYFSELERLSQKLKEYVSELSIVDSALPGTFGIPDLLNLLQKEASQNGLVLEKVNLESVSSLEGEENKFSSSPSSAKADSVKESKIIKIPVSFSVLGKYHAFKNFLQSIQKNARLIEIESISFSSPQKDDVFSFELMIRTHSY